MRAEQVLDGDGRHRVLGDIEPAGVECSQPKKCSRERSGWTQCTLGRVGKETPSCCRSDDGLMNYSSHRRQGDVGVSITVIRAQTIFSCVHQGSYGRGKPGKVLEFKTWLFPGLEKLNPTSF